MLDFINTWAGWLIGGSVLTALVVAALAYAVGAQKAVELVVALLQPSFAAVGRIAGEWITIAWENFRDGAKVIGSSVKAMFALAVCCGLIAGLVYVPTVHKTTKKVTEKLHRDYRFVPRKKAAPQPARQWIPSVFGYGAK